MLDRSKLARREGVSSVRGVLRENGAGTPGALLKLEGTVQMYYNTAGALLACVSPAQPHVALAP